MDLLDFEVDSLYFDHQEDEQVEGLLQKAAADYSDNAAELPLLQAYYLAPDSLNVLIALNRFYYYQHKPNDALLAATRALKLIGLQLAFPSNWQDVTKDNIQALEASSIATLRLYLFALKSIGFLNMRLNKLPLSQAIFEKLLELDSEDRMGAKELLKLVLKVTQEQQNVNA